MDQRVVSSLYASSVASSFFSEEICYPAERQVGFWKPGHISDHQSSKSAVSSSLDKFQSGGAHSVDCLDFLQPYLVNDLLIKLEQHSVGTERTANFSVLSRKAMDQDLGMKSNVSGQPASLFVEGNKVDLNKNKYENGFFSSSFSEIFKKKLRLSPSDDVFGQSIDTVNSHFKEDEPFESLEEMEAQTIGNLLPDDDDLLSGIIDEFDCIAQPNSGDDLEDFDLFSSGGGLELEADDSLSCYGGSRSLDLVGGIPNGQQGGSNGSSAGEHPYGEHPSRTLFVRNINSNVEDTELRDLFEQYGDIRTLYTACKHRGFVMISYYDIRAARNAMRALQNKPLRRRKLDIHFSIPKDNPTDKDINQGTLVVFNLDSSVSNDDLRQIFGVYGEIKEIRETPHKRHHKFIEFYDVRAAETALRALNRSDIAGKRIKLEPSRPGGARRLVQQLSPDLEQEESGIFCQQGSPLNDSLSGHYGSLPYHAIPSGSLDNGAFLGLPPATQPPLSSFTDTTFHAISSNAPYGLSSPIRVASVGNHGNQSGFSEGSHSLEQLKFGFQCMPNFHPHSLPECHNGIVNGIPYNSPSTMPALPANINSRPADGIENRNIHRVGSSGLTNHSFDHNEGGFGGSGDGNFPLNRHHYVFSNPNSYQPHPLNPMMWPNSPSFVNGIPVHSPSQLHGLPRAPQQMSNVLPLHHHHVGSAPAMNPPLWDRRHAYAADPAEASAFHLGSLGNGSMSFSGGSTLHQLELASHNMFPHVGGNCVDLTIPSTNVGLPSPQQICHMFPSRNPMIPMPASFDSSSERTRGRRNEANSSQADNKKQFELDIDRIFRGEDSRTTLMIKNIPNKYTSKMLLAAIDEHHRGTYDFVYLPIDFKNKCNVGYAFINMIDPLQIVPFFQAFNGKKWEKFNSEKVASLAYARIQGKAALIAHFQNSSLMNEDKRCRPILFHSGGPNAGDQEPFPMGVNIRSRTSKPKTDSNEDNHEGSPSTSPNGSSSVGSAKDVE